MISRREWVTRTLCDDAGQSACFSGFFFIFPSSLFFTITYSHFVQKNSATEIPQSEQLNFIHRQPIFFMNYLIFFVMFDR